MRKRTRQGGRREPFFESGVSGFDVRLTPEDRPAYASPARPRPRRGAAHAGDEPASHSAPPPRRRPRRTGPGLLRRLLYRLAVLGLWAGIIAVGLVAWFSLSLPAIQSLDVPARPPEIRIVGVDGSAIASRGEMTGEDVKIKTLPKYLPQAFVAIEDRRFYSHFGIDPQGIARAIVVNITGRGVREGGSTLTQQLAKNLFLTQDKTISRKIQEVLLALWLERKYAKAQILELYMNRVYFGAGAWGVEAAAQRYFGKGAKDLSLSESAMLAGLVKAPSRLAPNRNLKAAQERAQLVLAAMQDVGFITRDAQQIALLRPAKAIATSRAGSENYVADWVMDVLNDVVPRRDIDLVVETTLDMRLQKAAEQALVSVLDRQGQKFDVQQGALVAMDSFGAVRALVGGRSYNDSQYNRAVVAKRQPGSAFKPFVYLTALEHGLTPQTIRQDAPLALKGWNPENYSKQYLGSVSLQQALAMSLNTVAIRLALEVGPKAVARTAQRLGIASKLDPNPSLALGTSEVTMLELVGAYVPFANGGIGVTPHIINRVVSGKGEELYRRDLPALGQVISPEYVGAMNSMLHETMRTGTARRADLPGWMAAGKTGTSQDFRDAWFIGYTGRLVTGVWLGNDDASPTKRASGSGLPVEIWSQFMRTAHDGQVATALPGFAPSGGGGLFGGPTTTPSPPPAMAEDPGSAHPAPAPPSDDGFTLDRFLLEKVFGR